MAVYTRRVHVHMRRVHGRYTAMYRSCIRSCTGRVRYTAVYGLFTRPIMRTRAVYTAMYGPCRPVCTAEYGPSTRPVYTARVHDCVRAVCTAIFGRVCGAYTAVYTAGGIHGRVHWPCTPPFSPFSAIYIARTRPCNGPSTCLLLTVRVLGRYTTVYTGRLAPCTQPCTCMYTGRVDGPYAARVHEHVDGRIRAVYTVVYMARRRPSNGRVHGRNGPHTTVTGCLGPCTRPCRPVCHVHDGPCTRPCACTRPVYTAAYVPCTRPCTWRIHCLVTAVYTYARVGRPSNGRPTRPCTRPAVCVHGREQAVYTAAYGPCRPVYTAVCVPCTRRAVYVVVYTARVHEHIHGRPYTARVYCPCTRPCTGHVHGHSPCMRRVRSVLLRFSLQKTPFMPKRTATNPLHSKSARTTGAPSAALRTTTVLRSVLIIA